MICFIRSLLKNESGSISIWGAFSVLMIIGIFAFAIDAGRYLVGQKILQSAANHIVLTAADHFKLLDENDFESYLTAQISLQQQNLKSEFVFGATGALFKKRNVIVNSSQSSIQIELEVHITPLFLQYITDADLIKINAVAKAEQLVEETEIVFVLDGSNGAELEVENTVFSNFLRLINSQNTQVSKIGVGIIPHSTELMNVAPRKQWVNALEWPDAVPPNVPGIAKWNGPLTDQRWCIKPRPAEFNLSVPSTDPFPLEMEITVVSGSDGSDEYSVTTTIECPATRVSPIHKSNIDSGLILGRVQSGSFDPGIGIMWGLRSLHENWVSSWGRVLPERPKKMIIMLASSDFDSTQIKTDRLSASCQLAANEDVKLIILDLKNISSTLEGKCGGAVIVSTAHENEQKRAVYSIVQSLAQSRLQMPLNSVQ